jgi:hypothetical protein
MKVFIFGAGASQGSQLTTPHDEFKAPLTNELFNKYYEKHAEEVSLYQANLDIYRN